ncbi:CBS domain-containing protein [Xylophilus sp. GW821-FHT01B05]
MFYIYGLGGRGYSGDAEGLPPVSALRRVQASEAVRVSAQPQDTAPRPHGGVAQDALAAYGQQARSAPRLVREVSELMTSQVLSLPASATLAEALQALDASGFGQAPVLDAHGQLVGLLTRAQLLAAGPAGGAATVHAHMLSPVPAVAPATDVRRVAQVLVAHELPGLPVIDEKGALCGFIARGDLLRAMVADPPLDLWG